jgi:hypothetical protein
MRLSNAPSTILIYQKMADFKEQHTNTQHSASKVGKIAINIYTIKKCQIQNCCRHQHNAET